MVVPLYISESAPTSIRGRMIAIQQLMVTIGIVIASIVNTLIIVLIGKKDPLNGLEWRLALAMQCVPALALSVIMLFMPESPRWLAEKGREDEALATIAKLRSSKESDRLVQEEFGDILDGVKFERTIGTGSWLVSFLILGLNCLQRGYITVLLLLALFNSFNNGQV